MTEVKVTVDDRQAKRAIRALNAAPRRMTSEILRALREASRDVAKETRVLLRKSRGQASKPGQPPARQTGTLAKNIRFRRARGLAYNVLVARDGYYGKFHETGTEERSSKRGRRGRLEPRPFLTAAREDLDNDITDRIRGAIERSLREAAQR